MTNKATGTQDSRVAAPATVPPSDVAMIKVIQGLTLHLPINKTEVQESLHGPLFILFASCMKSKMKLKLRSMFDEQLTQWVVFLFIENELISKGNSESNEKLQFQSYDSPLHCKFLIEAKVSAACKALDLLKTCPLRQITRRESFLRPGEKVRFLKLYLDDPCPKREDCLTLLTESCRKCNLPVTWWDDEGCEVFKSSCITVLLINFKPICYAWGDNLEDSKKETAAKAILLLKTSQEVVSKRKYGELNSSTQTGTKVPGLTLHLPCKGRPPNASVTIQRSVSRSQLSLKFNDMGIVNKNGADVHATNLVIGNTVVAWGYGKDAELSRKNIVWDDILESLLHTQPLVCDPDEESQSVLDSQPVMCGPGRKPESSFDDTLPVVCGSDKESQSLVDTQPIVCDPDEEDQSLVHTQPVVCGLDKESQLVHTQTVVCGSDKESQSLVDFQLDVCDPDKKSQSLVDTQHVVCDMDKDSQSLVHTQPVVCGTDKDPGSLLSTDEKTNFEATNTVVPGLTMYVRYEGPWIHERSAHSAIEGSLSRCKLTKKLKSMDLVLRNGRLVSRAALFIGSTIVAWGYGNTLKSARKNISWEGVLESLLKTQPVVCIDSERLSKNARRQRKKLLANLPEVKAKKENERRELLTFLDHDLDTIHKGNEGDELYIVHSEWLDEDGGVESMVDSDEVIRKYMECL